MTRLVNCLIFWYGASSVVTTIAGRCGTATYSDGIGVNARFSTPFDVAVDDRRGRIIVADRDNHRIRLLTPLAGTICVSALCWDSVAMRLFSVNSVRCLLLHIDWVCCVGIWMHRVCVLV
jgi:hypothetical protein